MRIKTYSELIKFNTFEERFEYLKLNGVVGESTFGFDRYINQKFYNSYEWKKVRNYVITRDCGCDIGCLDREIPDGVIIVVHHMNPIQVDDILNVTDYLMNPEYLITMAYDTHKALHYSDINLLTKNDLVIRKSNDMVPWKK